MEELKSLRCPNCGGQMECVDGKTFRCLFCLDIFELKEELTSNDVIELNRGEHYRKHNRYDEAIECYDEILKENPDNAIALWGAFLSEYGIEYVDDYDGKKIPTCHRANMQSVTTNRYYKKLPAEYKKRAEIIEKTRKEVVEKMNGLEEYDVFICYKNQGKDGKPTKESKWGRKIYEELTYKKGLKVFFAGETLTNSNAEYEPQIFNALRTSKIMFVLASSLENVNAAWVKNEWKRFYEMSRGGKKVIRVVYEELEPYDFPKELQKSQMINQDEGDWMECIYRAVDDIFVDKEAEARKKQEEEQKRRAEEQRRHDEELESRLMEKLGERDTGRASATPVAQSQTTPLLKRAKMFLEDKDFESAEEYAEKVLDLDPECADAYVVKLCCDYELQKESGMVNINNFHSNSNYMKAVRFAKGSRLEELRSYRVQRQEVIYQSLLRKMQNTQTPEAWKSLAAEWKTLGSYKDSAEQIKECARKEELAKQERVYQSLIMKMASTKKPDAWKRLAAEWKDLGTYEDSAEKAQLCHKKAEWAQMQEELDQAEKYAHEYTYYGYASAINILNSRSDWAPLKDKASIYALVKTYQEEQRRLLAKEHARKVRKTVKICISVTLAIAAVAAIVFAIINKWKESHVKVNGITYERNGDSFIVSNCDKSVIDVTIPKTMNGLPVTGIGKGAFKNNGSLKSVAIPESITSIGVDTFKGCNGLTTMSIPFIGSSAEDSSYKAYFGYYFGADSYSENESSVPSSLKTVTLTGGTSVEANTFYNCKYIKEIKLPDTLTTIQDYAFNGCSGLTSMVVPDSVTLIRAGAFGGCNSLESLSVPFVGKHADLETPRWTVLGYIFGDGNFDDNMYTDKNIKKTSSGEFTSQIKDEDSDSWYYFMIPTSLKSVTVTNQTVVPDYAFNNCDMIQNVTFTKGVTSIGTSSYQNCTAFKELPIPNTVTKIGANAFHGCSQITSLTIPNSVVEIRGGAFGGCNSLESLTIPFVGRESSCSTARWAVFGYIFGDDDITDDSMNYSSTIRKTSSGKYTSQLLYSGKNWFYFMIPTSLKNVTVTKQTKIPASAFYNCDMLENITFTQTVSSVGTNAFTNCTATVVK